MTTTTDNKTENQDYDRISIWNKIAETVDQDISQEFAMKLMESDECSSIRIKLIETADQNISQEFAMKLMESDESQSLSGHCCLMKKIMNIFTMKK